MIGIVGQGFVGNAVYQKWRKYYDVLTYDLNELKSTSTLNNLVMMCDTIFVCLPTPMRENGSCDLNILHSSLLEINTLTKFAGNDSKTIIIKSTIPPGSTEKLNKQFSHLNILFNPEFLTERNAEEDYNNQDRIIIGGPRPYSTKVVRLFSKVFPKARIIKTHSTYAEMVKYMTNTFLSTKVSFANEIYQLCEEVGADYDKVVEYATLDERLGKSHWMVPGHDGDFGFGGHCFPKDLSALIYLSEELNTTNNVLRATRDTNDEVRKDRDWENMKGRAVS
tara:strand:+ start:10733 stop:11569 length:837 start_codon:yes stop_codon:yes gene_type:complete